jgi:hypothetical protein
MDDPYDIAWDKNWLIWLMIFVEWNKKYHTD